MVFMVFFRFLNNYGLTLHWNFNINDFVKPKDQRELVYLGLAKKSHF